MNLTLLVDAARLAAKLSQLYRDLEAALASGDVHDASNLLRRAMQRTHELGCTVARMLEESEPKNPGENTKPR